ncbi:MAG TPA: 4a-hydroxytetrahydrobiopterin dehydratase [Acidisarcina sp.]
MAVLSSDQIEERLRSCSGWSLDGLAILREFTFPDFARAMTFVNRIATAAEEANHHPDFDIRYTKVVLRLSSHDAGGLTSRDFNLAHRINLIEP